MEDISRSRDQRAPYRSTPVFDEHTIPAALQGAHATKAGVWGMIRVLHGKLRYWREDGSPPLPLSPNLPGLVLPCEPHHVEVIGPVEMRVDFYDHSPEEAV